MLDKETAEALNRVDFIDLSSVLEYVRDATENAILGNNGLGFDCSLEEKLAEQLNDAIRTMRKIWERECC